MLALSTSRNLGQLFYDMRPIWAMWVMDIICYVESMYNGRLCAVDESAGPGRRYGSNWRNESPAM